MTWSSAFFLFSTAGSDSGEWTLGVQGAEVFQVLKDRFLALVSTFKWWFPHPDDRRRKSVGAQNHIDDLVQHVAVSNAAFSDDSYIYADTVVTTEHIKKALIRSQAGPEYRPMGGGVGIRIFYQGCCKSTSFSSTMLDVKRKTRQWKTRTFDFMMPGLGH